LFDQHQNPIVVKRSS